MRAQVESLEPRQLLSGNWTTVDDVDGQQACVLGMAADAAGNVYAGGAVADAAGARHDVVRMKPAGSDQWATILNDPHTGQNWFENMTVAADGDVYVTTIDSSDTARVLEWDRSAGATSFTEISAMSPVFHRGMAADANGDVYAAGQRRVQTGVNKWKQPIYTDTWSVWKQAGGEGAFALVDTLADSVRTVANDITVVLSGPAAGIYVAGLSNDATGGRWLVRRSTDGGNTWTTIDSFRYDQTGTGGSQAFAMAGDGAGNLYVSGTADTHVKVNKRTSQWTFGNMVRKGTIGANGAWSWTVEDYVRHDTSASQFETRDMTIDGAGKVYVACEDHQPSRQGFVRSNAGGNWAVVDSLQLAADKEYETNGIVTDADGDVFVGGWAYDASDVVRWVVRSPTAPTAAMSFSTTSVVTDESSPDDHTLAEELLEATGR